MQICIPVVEDRGLESRVCEHFGSAPAFVLVDTETEACRGVDHGHIHREHGSCAPLATLLERRVDVFAVGGIGRGALGRIEASGARVFRANPGSVQDVLTAFRAGTLLEVTPESACVQGHGHHHDEGHHHHHGLGDTSTGRSGERRR